MSKNLQTLIGVAAVAAVAYWAYQKYGKDKKIFANG
jgi:uncharacterized membrane protein YebE (DUF533 family)